MGVKEKVSVVVPVYNSEKTIDKCVRSIVKGVYQNIEVILIDDDSEDKSFVICKKLAKEFNNITVIHNEQNRGVSYARNQGLLKASGKYIMFVDSDDWVESEYISTFVKAIEEYKVSFAISGYVNHDEVVNCRIDYFGWNDVDDVKECMLNSQLLELYHNRLLQQLWNKIFLTEIIRDNKIKFDESISMGEDFRFVLGYINALNEKRCLLINKYIYHYMRNNISSLMSEFGKENIKEPLKNMKLLLDLSDIEENEEKVVYNEEKLNIMNQYAYKIMHNQKYSFSDKIFEIHSIAEKHFFSVFFENIILVIKEQIISIKKCFS